MNSTTAPAVHSVTEPQQKSSPTSWPAQLLPPADTALCSVRPSVPRGKPAPITGLTPICENATPNRLDITGRKAPEEGTS